MPRLQKLDSGREGGREGPWTAVTLFFNSKFLMPMQTLGEAHPLTFVCVFVFSYTLVNKYANGAY